LGAAEKKKNLTGGLACFVHKPEKSMLTQRLPAVAVELPKSLSISTGSN
jgi:hypothetical protein